MLRVVPLIVLAALAPVPTGLPFRFFSGSPAGSTQVLSGAPLHLSGGSLTKSAYLIPESGTVLVHVNAVDLNTGTYKIGGAWTPTGTTVYNSAASPRPSVGPFSDTNYYFQTSVSPANATAPPFTVVVLLSEISVSSPTTQVPFATGSCGVAGWYTQAPATWVMVNGGPCSGAASSGGFTNGQFSVAIGGMDSSNVVYAQLNGGLMATAAGGAYTKSSGSTIIGKIASATTGQYLNGYIYEVMVSTATPSAAAFTAIYNAVLANE